MRFDQDDRIKSKRVRVRLSRDHEVCAPDSPLGAIFRAHAPADGHGPAGQNATRRAENTSETSVDCINYLRAVQNFDIIILLSV